MMDNFNWSMLNAEELMWLNQSYYNGQLSYEESMMYERMNVDNLLMEQASMQPVVPMGQPVPMGGAMPMAAGGNLESMTTDELMTLVAQRNKLAEKLIKFRLKEAKKRAKSFR